MLAASERFYTKPPGILPNDQQDPSYPNPVLTFRILICFLYYLYIKTQNLSRGGDINRTYGIFIYLRRAERVAFAQLILGDGCGRLSRV